MTAAPEDVLARATRCLLGSRTRQGPQITPMAFWSDGAALWMATSAATVRALGLQHDPACVAYVPPAAGDDPGAIVRGRARVYSTDDPVGLVLHTPTISAAVAALAARNAGTVLGWVQDAPRIPPRWWPRSRAMLRLVVDELRAVDPPDVGAGVAPALPTVVPADVRRAVAGVRRVVVVYADDGLLQATPAVWGAGYALTTPPSLRPPPGAPAVAAVDVEHHTRPTRAVGLALAGRMGADGRLQPERATSWHGFDVEVADVEQPAPGGVTLPD